MLTKIKPLNHMTKPTRENQKPKNDIHYYSAVATEQTSAKLSLDIQEKICRQKSENDGYKVLKTWRDGRESFKHANQTEFQLMLTFCGKNKDKIARLVVYRMDRISRKVADYLTIKAHLQKLGIKIISATERSETAPEENLQKAINVAIVEFDKQFRSELRAENGKS